LKDQGNPSSVEPKALCEQQFPLFHVVVTVSVDVMLFESNPLDTSSVGSGNGSVHSFSRGKIGVGCIDASGSLQMLMIATPPSRKVVSYPNLID